MPKEEPYPLGDDGLIVEKVGAWAKTKHKLLTDYIQASGGARSKYHNRSGAAYIDVFCGSGRSLIRDTNEYIDGSSVAAHKSSLRSPAPFSSIEVSDSEKERLTATHARLRALNAPVVATPGPAIAAMARIVERVDPRGLHFSFLDPYNLGTLSFELFKILKKLERIDILVHISIADLQRNVDLYTSEDYGQFDSFAPGWRGAIDYNAMSKTAVRAAILNYWSDQVTSLGLTKAKHSELITGPGNQRLYFLSLLSRSPLAHKLWHAISSAAKSPSML